MTKSERRLGRGLAALIGDLTPSTPPPTPTPQPLQQPTSPTELPISSIHPNPQQPRTQFDPHTLTQLADSIRTTGLLQPVVVRPAGDSYQLVAGERRWRAAQQAGLQSIPVVIRQVPDDQLLELALIENIQRDDLNPVDRAQAYAHCCDRFHLTPETLAAHLGEDRSTVSNYIRLLDLPTQIHDLLRTGQLTMGHARALLGLANPDRILALASSTVTDGLSVRQLEALVRDQKQPSSTPAAPAARPPKRPLIQELEERFRHALQTKVAIAESRKRNTGKIVIEYNGIDDFNRIAERLGVQLEEL